MTSVLAGLTAVHSRIDGACRRSHRARSDVRLVAVSKGVPAALVREALQRGQQDFGESYLAEASQKQDTLSADPPATWHFIGPVQSNKTAGIAERFAWVHGVDRLRIAERLDRQRPAAMERLCVCVQVNISGEASKSGCAPADTPQLCAAVARLPRLRLRGLMAIPALAERAEDSREEFARLAALAAAIRSSGAVDSADFDTLSMGMSGDLEVAIEEGATLVRIGSAIFGERPRP